MNRAIVGTVLAFGLVMASAGPSIAAGDPPKPDGWTTDKPKGDAIDIEARQGVPSADSGQGAV